MSYKLYYGTTKQIEDKTNSYIACIYIVSVKWNNSASDLLVNNGLRIQVNEKIINNAEWIYVHLQGPHDLWAIRDM